MYYLDSLQVSTAMSCLKVPFSPSFHSILKVCLFVIEGLRTVMVLVAVFLGHSCHSSGYRSLLCFWLDCSDRFCEEVQDLDLMSHTGLEVEVEEHLLVSRRKDSVQMGDYCG